jgi:hypothetical protein
MLDFGSAWRKFALLRDLLGNTSLLDAIKVICRGSQRQAGQQQPVSRRFTALLLLTDCVITFYLQPYYVVLLPFIRRENCKILFTAKSAFVISQKGKKPSHSL